MLLSAGGLSPLAAQEPLFQAGFEGDELGGFPESDWTSTSAGSGLLEVVRDTEDWLGEGVEAKYLRVRDGGNFTLRGTLSEGRDVAVLRFSMIGRNSPNDSRWLQINFLAGDGAERAHVLSLRLIDQTIRNIGASYGNNDELLEFLVILNNGSSPIGYKGPGGDEHPLGSERAAVWVNDQRVIPEYEFAKVAGPGPVVGISFQADSTAVTSFDLSRVEVFGGEFVEARAAPIPTVRLGEEGHLEYTEDLQGDRIPDFSNAGYMGGGVPIPEVPVVATVVPRAGDDRSRIQEAIDKVSGMPLQEDGFRGAVLLKAGNYEVSDTLTIGTSGVVLRGEGDGPEGTVLHATGTFQYTLIDVSGSGGWQEVTGSRRNVMNSYVPVGARSFEVESTSGYEVGDAIIVYRPSTEEWISAIGMDQIPERDDGLPVYQWTAGSRDLKYDRIITAIEGNKITIDAPLANSLDEQYGGGYIYRYTFPGRIFQVGVENIRAVSAFDGGEWDTSQTDENHAWSFVVLNRIQNGWVRDTTSLHFGFGNTYIETFSKWITVQDSENLFPVSTISGSRRYPFYIRGQLSLVQRCYANYARHDYGTSSLTHGPNVFLDSSGDHSYSDTGPHHRWATGTLYDNIRVPNRDIAVQNRLNMGSGHGWAGANHVVWNSTANRIVVQNPPTAQNWAIGVTGTKWAGAFPGYAQDGYWISHGTPVEPESLYLKQLEDRLAPEGTGGAISVVAFDSEVSAELAAGETAQFPVSRVGIRDGMTQVQFVLEGEGADLIDAPGEIAIPANQNQGVLDVGLAEGAELSTKKTVTVKLVHAAGYSVGSKDTITLTIPPSPLEAWRTEQFTSEQLDDESISGDAAAPAGDGVGNLLKYALNLLPFARADAGDLPQVSLEDGRLILTFARGDSLTDIKYAVEVSSDLRTWEAGDGATEDVEVTGDGDWKQVTVGDRTPFSAADRRFIRLRVRRLQ